jgi:hypothetical protein
VVAATDREHVGGAILAVPHAAVRLVVERAREPRDQPARHVLANEADRTALAVAHVESQVQLWESHEPRPRESPHAGIDEIERHQADQCASFPAVELETDRQARRENIVGHSVGDEQDVEPAGAQERSPGHGQSPSKLDRSSSLIG